MHVIQDGLNCNIQHYETAPLKATFGFSLPFIPRQTTFAVYLLTFIGMLVYTFTLNLGHLWVVFLTAGILGYVPMNGHRGDGIWLNRRIE